MSRPKKQYWDLTEIKALAKLMGVPTHHIKEILSRKRSVSVARAKKLQSLAAVLKKDIPWQAWIDHATEHKAFK